jgi:hypothetical protein
LAVERGRVSEGRRRAEVEEFLANLRARGRSEHTERSYAQGLDHFAAWLASNDVDLDDVRKSHITTYISAFASEPKAGATASGEEPRGPRTVNHRLSVLGSFFAFLIECDAERDSGPWKGRPNPVPKQRQSERRVLVGGRDAPPRGRRAELRRSVPAELPKTIEPELAEQLIGAARSVRDKAILALLLGDHCPRGLVCLGCVHAQPKQSAAPTFARMATSHKRELAKARKRGEPAGQIAARELEVERITSALRRARELTGDVAEAIEAQAL